MKGFRKEFDKRVSKLRGKLNEISLNIIICGPGQVFTREQEIIFDKRKEIKDQLKAKGHNAFFVEDEKGIELSLLTEEIIRAKEADIIILLASSYGAVGEAQIFSRFNDIVYKMIIFMDKERRGGFNHATLSLVGRAYNNFFEYSFDEDIASCNVLKKVLEIVQARRELRFLEGMI